MQENIKNKDEEANRIIIDVESEDDISIIDTTKQDLITDLTEEDENISIINTIEKNYLLNITVEENNFKPPSKIELKRQSVLKKLYALEKKIDTIEDEYQSDLVDNNLVSIEKEIVDLADVLPPPRKIRKHKQGTSTKRDLISLEYEEIKSKKIKTEKMQIPQKVTEASEPKSTPTGSSQKKSKRLDYYLPSS